MNEQSQTPIVARRRSGRFPLQPDAAASSPASSTPMSISNPGSDPADDSRLATSRTWQTIVVPYDFSNHSQAALHTAIDLARRFGSRLHLLHVVAAPAQLYAYGGVMMGAAAVAAQENLDAIQQGATNALHEVTAKLDTESVPATAQVLESSDIAGTISRTVAELGADLVVMGTHGRTGLAHVFLGSVTERTLRNCPCPVLTVRADSDESANDSAVS